MEEYHAFGRGIEGDFSGRLEHSRAGGQLRSHRRRGRVSRAHHGPSLAHRLGERLVGCRPLEGVGRGDRAGRFRLPVCPNGTPVPRLGFLESHAGRRARCAADLALDCEFLFGDAEEPPFEANAFDCVSSRHLLFNLPRPGVAVRQWVRILKPGGKMILIGDDCGERRTSAFGAGIRRLLGRSLWRLFRPRARGWNAGPDYIKAVSECPLFRHSAGAVRAVMEAAGLQEIRSCPTEEIYLARLKSYPLVRKLNRPATRPFILVGVKP